MVALYEKAVPFEARMVDLGNPQARRAFTDLWPTAKIPLLQDEDRVVPETSIMIEYIDERYPAAPLLPEDRDQRLKARLWDRLFDLNVMTPMQQAVAQYLRPAADRNDAVADEARDRLRLAYTMIETRLDARPWAAGEVFSIADCAAAPALFYAAAVVPFLSDHPNLMTYFERLVERPSVARVIGEARPWFDHFPIKDAIPARFR